MRGALDDVETRQVALAGLEGGAAAAASNVAKQLREHQKREQELLARDKQELLAITIKSEDATAGIAPVLMVQPSAPRPPQVVGETDASQVSKRARHDVIAASKLDKLRLLGHVDSDLAAAQIEPVRAKCHWDHLLEEAVWLAREVHGERGWKQKAARQVAHAAKKGLEEMAKIKGGTIGHGLRKEGDDELALRKIAKAMAGMVQGWWKQLQMLALERDAAIMESERRKSVQEKLEQVVDQTQRLSSAAAAALSQENPDDAEFAEGDDRDELGTLLEAEREEDREQVAMEVDALQKEANMDIQSLLAQYGGYKPGGNGSEEEEENDEEEEDEQEEEEEEVQPEEKKLKIEEAAGDEYKEEHDEDEMGTLLEAEQQEDRGEVTKEVDALQKEADMDIQSLLAQYGGYRLGGNGSEEEEEDVEEEEEEDEQVVSSKKRPPPSVSATAVASAAAPKRLKADEDDYKEQQDEDEMGTLLEAEQQEDRVEVEKEVNALQQEADMDIESLLAQYGGYKLGGNGSEEEDVDEEDDGGVEAMQESGGEEEEDEEEEEGLREGEVAPFGTAELLGGGEDAGRAVMESAAREAALAQPTGTTLATTSVRTALPSRLRGPGPLREYQHIGLDWLVSLYDKGLNGILADEMGLGKTIQTISLLAHLAETKGIWGPHLIVVPTSVLLNWEKELMTWYPSFKVLAYYGSAKQRLERRQGWGRPNAFHVCITTYNVVLQDASVFRRRQWQYLVLDEAHNIRNFRSKRWQVLLTLKTKRRLLLTGTPLQNSLMELWSLLHFLMPHVFASHSEFKEWFASPLDTMIEEKQVDTALVQRLHTILQPFLLRRKKNDVERQLPDKFEHVQLCRLSKRQRGLYEEFLASRRKTMEGGNVLGVMNILMQLRKVCNHPELFEERPIVSPFDCAVAAVTFPRLIRESAVSSACLPFDHASLLDSEVGGPEDARRALLLQREASVEIARSRTSGVAPVEKLVSAPSFMGAAGAVLGAGQLLAALEQSRQQQREERISGVISRGLLRVALERPLLGRRVVRAVSVVSPSVSGASPLFDLSEMRERVVRRAREVCFVIPRARALLSDRKDEILGAMAPDWDANQRALLMRQQLFFPDKRLLQYDCGKLQALAVLLARLYAEGHRVLIFTQMTRMLDILETFLAFHHYAYLRLDGSTRTEKRYEMMERFNEDRRIFCFILSTRSGGLGINLTGADTVIFYDSDWNPAMDAQAQDRAHRIGQTKTVHIYRLVSEKTVEENILKKALQKRQLEQLTLQEGEFSAAALAAMAAAKTVDVRELLGDDAPSSAMTLDARAWDEATHAAEEAADAAAAERALDEERAEAAQLATELPAARGAAEEEEEEEEEEEGAASAARQLDARIAAALDPLQRLALRVVAASPQLLLAPLDKKKSAKSALVYDARAARSPKNVYKPN